MTIDFESDLRMKMAGIKSALPPGLAQDVVQSHRRHQKSRRTAARALMAVLPAVALVAGGATVAAHRTGSASSAATHPAVLTAAYVTKKVDATLGSADYVVEVTGNAGIVFNSTGSSIRLVFVFGGKPITTWTDLVTGNREGAWPRTATDTQTTWATGKQPNVKYVTVDAATKTVWNAPSSALADQPYASPSQLKQFLATNQATIAGKRVINGQSAVDLRLPKFSRRYPSSLGFSLSFSGVTSVDYWVNARTFQVIKFVFTFINGGKSTSSTSYYHWLPRTKSLVAQVNTPQIPAGYRQVRPPK